MRVDKLAGPAFDRQPVEHPRALRQALDKTGGREKLEMSRQARLTLVQDLDEFAHGQLAMRQQGQYPGARDLAGSAKLLHRQGQTGEVHIMI